MRDSLLEKAALLGDTELVDVAKLIEGRLRTAWQDLQDFAAIPRDARCPCLCGDEELCKLPLVLEEQTIEIEPPFIEVT